MIIGLTIILLLVLFLPFTEPVEGNVEVFLFIMGVLSVMTAGVLNKHLIEEAVTHPINITLAVLIAGLLFRWFRAPLENAVQGLSKAMPYRLFIFLFVLILGLLSSLITAIIAAIILVAVVGVLKMDKRSEIRLVVLACFAIGMGAALTPIGEPLSTIVVSKLNEDFFYLLRSVGVYVIPGVIVFGIMAACMVKVNDESTVAGARAKFVRGTENKPEAETYAEIMIRSLKVYLFVMALTFLGAGFQPFIERYLLDLSPFILYWINMISAVLDNATLAAAEISPVMDESTIRDILLGLLVSGGMLIPGNIPNIIAAGKLKITSLQYAKFAVPVGLLVMVLYFIVILVLG
jgi:predicted cation transporter